MENVSRDTLVSVRNSIQETVGCWNELLDLMSRIRNHTVKADFQRRWFIMNLNSSSKYKEEMNGERQGTARQK